MEQAVTFVCYCVGWAVIAPAILAAVAIVIIVITAVFASILECTKDYIQNRTKRK